jgi:hypothetical protein
MGRMDSPVILPKPPTNIRPPRLSDIWQMCANLRQDEIDKYMAMNSEPHWDFEQAARRFDRMIGHKICLFDTDGAPIIVAGWEPIVPGVFDGWMLGTEEGWDKHWRAITRVTRWGMDYLMASGAHRLQIMSLASRDKACEWYERGLKMRQEGTLALYGRHGEDVATFVRLRSSL